MRTSEDVLRSLKRYLALTLAGPPTISAAKFFPDPASADPAAVAGLASPHLWWDYAPDGSGPHLAGFDSFADVTEGLVRTTVWNGAQWWGNPPGAALDTATWELVSLDADPHAWSPGLVRGCQNVNSQDWWESVLAVTRWRRLPQLLTGSGIPYRLAMLTADAAASGTNVAVDTVPDPADWDVRFFYDPGEVEYPCCVVKSAGPAVVSPAREHYYEVTQPFVVYAYPSPPNRAKENPSDAQLAAERTRTALVQAFAAASADGARPMRFPLYDYDGAPDTTQGSRQRRTTDFVKVADLSVDVQAEPTDPWLAVVVADLRLNWRATMPELRGTHLVHSVEIVVDPS